MKPCPFCGAPEPIVIFSDFFGAYQAHMHCASCSAAGPCTLPMEDKDHAEESAEKMWNERPA